PPDMTPLSSKIVPISVAFSAVLASNVNASYLAVYGPNMKHSRYSLAQPKTPLKWEQSLS
ncbi:hypothetical protein, partial [Aeromonas caviae]|uniref:hypothetical protein n=1 Tax=Aeromonas caviae TaxID=648 RepID=UPI001CC4E4C0